MSLMGPAPVTHPAMASAAQKAGKAIRKPRRQTLSVPRHGASGLEASGQRRRPSIPGGRGGAPAFKRRSPFRKSGENQC
jgi:hypothetical protein